MKKSLTKEKYISQDTLEIELLNKLLSKYDKNLALPFTNLGIFWKQRKLANFEKIRTFEK